MSDFLVAPFRGKTEYKIDPTLKGDTIIWPSSKIGIDKADILFGSGGFITSDKWSLFKNGVTQNLIASSDGNYQLVIKHWCTSFITQPLQFTYSINNGPKISIGWIYYAAIQDIGVLLNLKRGDAVTIHSINTGYSMIHQWIFRKLPF
jgi:hypothetical protein